MDRCLRAWTAHHARRGAGRAYSTPNEDRGARIPWAAHGNSGPRPAGVLRERRELDACAIRRARTRDRYPTLPWFDAAASGETSADRKFRDLNHGRRVRNPPGGLADRCADVVPAAAAAQGRARSLDRHA